MAAALSFREVRFSYHRGRPAAVEDVTLAIEAASATTILGPNGAGKSTLLFLALGWLRPSGGSVFIEGRPLNGYTRSEMGRMVGLVPQRENFQFEYSVLEYVLLGRLPYLSALAQPGEADYRAALGALARVGLGGFEHRSVLRLSGGERQMVLIARSLAQQTRILLLDEPTAHLDLHNKARIVRLLRELREEGVTLVMTTHEPELASSLASQVVLMSRGQILYAGGPDIALTSERLSGLYDQAIEVVSVSGRSVVLW
jgi:iron complex transport system ATP-binding protein